MRTFVRLFFVLSLTVTAAFLGIKNSYSAPIRTWDKVLGGSLEDVGRAIETTADGGYIVAGYTSSWSAYGNSDAWVLKIDSNGKITWQRAYGATDTNEMGYQIKVLNDGGYFLIGHNFILKLDINGSIVWQKRYGDYSGFSGGEVTEDGGLVIVGSQRGVPPGDALVLRMDSLGNVLWSKTYGPGGFSAIKRTSEGNYIVAGADQTSWPHPWGVKIDASGNVIWQKLYPYLFDYPDGAFNFVQETNDGGYIFVGSDTAPFTYHNWDYTVVKTNADGTVLWHKSVGTGTTAVAYSVAQTSDGGYVVIGDNAGWLWMIKFDALGNILWQKYYGNAFGYGYAIKPSHDGGMIAVGQIGDYEQHTRDLYVIKVGPDGDCGQLDADTTAQDLSSYQLPIDTNVVPSTISITAADVLFESYPTQAK